MPRGTMAILPEKLTLPGHLPKQTQTNHTKQ